MNTRGERGQFSFISPLVKDMKIKLNKKELDLLIYVLDRTYSYGWEGCLGGFSDSDKMAERKYKREMEMLRKLIIKIENDRH